MDHKVNPEIFRLSFETPVLNLLSSPLRLFVVLEHEIHIFDTNNLKFVKMMTTSLNPKGFHFLKFNPISHAPRSCCCIKIFGKRTTDARLSRSLKIRCLWCSYIWWVWIGLYSVLCVFNTFRLTCRLIDQLHQHPLQSFSFSSDGKFFGCASEAGTIIRVSLHDSYIGFWRIFRFSQYQRGRLSASHFVEEWCEMQKSLV